MDDTSDFTRCVGGDLLGKMYPPVGGRDQASQRDQAFQPDQASNSQTSNPSLIRHLFQPPMTYPPSSYRQNGGEHGSGTGTSTTPMLNARPPPKLKSASAYDRPVTRDVYVPLKIVEAQMVDTGSQRCYMKKVKKLRFALQLKLPGSTTWGGIYDGHPFIEGTVQWHIAQLVASQPWANHGANWRNIPGCFLTMTSVGQHKDGNNTLGCASLDPFFFPASHEWKSMPRNLKLVYIPDPLNMMTTVQISHYHVEAAACISETVMVPTGPMQRRGKRRSNVLGEKLFPTNQFGMICCFASCCCCLQCCLHCILEL